jgi:hypothetical protein
MSLPFRSPPARQRAPCSAARAEAMRDGATGLKKPRSGLQCVSFEMPALPAVRSHGKPEPYSACDASTASTGQSLSSERQRLESGGSLLFLPPPPALSDERAHTRRRPSAGPSAPTGRPSSPSCSPSAAAPASSSAGMGRPAIAWRRRRRRLKPPALARGFEDSEECGPRPAGRAGDRSESNGY